MLGLTRSGDMAAADWVFVAFFNPLRAFVERKMDDTLRRVRLEPEDVVQEVYAAAWANLEEAEFINSAAFLGWLEKIAVNKMHDLRRRALADKHDVLRQLTHGDGQASMYLDLVQQLTGAVPTPSATAARHEGVALLVGQMWRLSEDQRQVIHWRFLHGLPVAEVARRMERSEAAVHMLCHRALLKLRGFMGNPSRYLSRT